MNGKQHGKGTYTNAKGDSKEYEWREGKKVESPATGGSGAKKTGKSNPSPGTKVSPAKKKPAKGSKA